jgi:ribose 5-phosphate isomerase A
MYSDKDEEPIVKKIAFIFSETRGASESTGDAQPITIKTKRTMIGKKNAAEKAVELLADGMIVGLGSGSTATYAIQKIGDRVREGLKITAVATSAKSEKLAKELSITVLDPSAVTSIDVAVDGADEVDKQGNLIKGGGGSLLREKVIAFASNRFFVMVDESKLVETLGKKRSVPVEVIPFAAELTLKHIRMLGGEAVWRASGGNKFITDNGNFIADCRFDGVVDAPGLDMKLKIIPGVVETGLFLSQIVSGIFVGYENGDVKLLSLKR